MNLRHLMIAGFTLLLLGSHAEAQTLPSPTMPAGDDPASYSVYSLGIEGFHDVYREPGAGLDVSDFSNYISGTAAYKHYWSVDSDEEFVLGLDTRYSQGKDHYTSVSGESSGATQYEFENRITAGLQFNTESSGSFVPYTGIGWRYFMDQGKGSSTDLGYGGYDRRISQIYMPFGMDYIYKFNKQWSLTVNGEVDPLIHGNVESRLQDYGVGDMENRQTQGYGLRGGFLVGWTQDRLTYQAGPFVRYWTFENSNYTYAPSVGQYFYEPKNTRVQYGAEFKVLW